MCALHQIPLTPCHENPKYTLNSEGHGDLPRWPMKRFVRPHIQCLGSDPLFQQAMFVTKQFGFHMRGKIQIIHRRACYQGGHGRCNCHYLRCNCHCLHCNRRRLRRAADSHWRRARRASGRGLRRVRCCRDALQHFLNTICCHCRAAGNRVVHDRINADIKRPRPSRIDANMTWPFRHQTDYERLIVAATRRRTKRRPKRRRKKQGPERRRKKRGPRSVRFRTNCQALQCNLLQQFMQKAENSE